MDPTSNRGISRRAFAKSAVAIGGSAALAACLDRQGEVDVPRGPEELATLPERQHAWNEALASDEHGNDVAPRHHVVLPLDLLQDGTPTTEARERVEAGLQQLERAYERSHEGLLFTIGYSPAYFARFDADLPESTALPEPRSLSPLDDPELDEFDAALHLASDHAQVVLRAEEALFGEQSSLNGVDAPADLRDVFERGPRRTGFVGDGLPADNQDVRGLPDGDAVPEDAPLYMGFKSDFEQSQASEDRVTIQSGPFAGGTTQHVSRLRLHLEQWYEQDSREQRVAKMFCPAHAEEGRVEGTGANLGDDPGLEGECVEDTEADARNRGVVGHAQKSARAREDDSPVILRRDFDSTDGGAAGLHFVALQREIADFEATREQMNGTDLAEQSAVGPRNNNGIMQYVSVERRGNYLVPPRSLRSLPAPRPA